MEKQSLTDADWSQLARDRQNAAAISSTPENAMRQAYGKSIVNTFGQAAGLGVGATALYHLLRAMKQPGKKEKKYQNFSSGAPMIAKAAEQKEASDDLYTRIGGLIPRGAFGGQDAAPQSGVTPDPAHPFTTDPYKYRPAWAGLGTVGAGALGLYGGAKLVNYLANRKKKQDKTDEIEDAQKAYYAALAGKEANTLDAAFETYRDKKATVAEWLESFARPALQGAHAYTLASLLGGGLVGGKLMYDWTKDRTAGANLAKARASRARMKGLPTMWVDPDEIAAVKQQAAQATNE